MSEVKVVQIEEFKAQSDPREDVGERLGRVLTCGPAVEPRTLTPREVSHRFAMLAFLRQAR